MILWTHSSKRIPKNNIFLIYLPLLSSWFGRDTYFGFYVDWSTELGAIIMYMTIIPTIGSFFVGTSLYIEGMVADLRAALMECDEATKTHNEMWSIYVNEFVFHREVIEWGQLLSLEFRKKKRFICFYWHISSFAAKTSDLLSLIIFMHLLCCSIIIAFNLILLEASDRIDFQVMASIYIMLSETALNFLFCYLSERITVALSKIGVAFYESMWFHLPTRQQKLLALTIARSQQEFYYDGLGLVYCSLETFGRVSCFWILLPSGLK